VADVNHDVVCERRSGGYEEQQDNGFKKYSSHVRDLLMRRLSEGRLASFQGDAEHRWRTSP